MSLKRRFYLAAWALTHRGRARRCPACGERARRFAPFGSPPRPDSQCPGCGSLERHRALWLFMERRGLLAGRLRVLAVAPDPFLEQRGRRLPWEYLSVDIDPARAMRRMDLTRLDLPDGDRDLVIAFHVLEHIADDAAAMREIRRVLAPAGLALLEVPLDGDETDERFLGAPPEERARHYGQADHVRLYGDRDFRERLMAAGLEVESVSVGAEFDDELQRAALMPDERFFVASPARASHAAGGRG